MASVTGNTKTLNGISYTPTLTVTSVNSSGGYIRYRIQITVVVKNSTTSKLNLSRVIRINHNGSRFDDNPTTITCEIQGTVSAKASKTLASDYGYLYVGKTMSAQTVAFTAHHATIFESDLVCEMNVAIKTRYTVIYNTGGIGSNINQSIYWGETASNISPNATGYVFNNWYTGSTYRILVNFPRTITTATTFYGNWIENQYILKFNANGGESILPDVKLYYSQSYILPSEGVGKVGYHLIGWNANATGTSTSYSLGETVSKLLSSNNGVKTLYAVWEANE